MFKSNLMVLCFPCSFFVAHYHAKILLAGKEPLRRDNFLKLTERFAILLLGLTYKLFSYCGYHVTNELLCINSMD